MVATTWAWLNFSTFVFPTAIIRSLSRSPVPSAGPPFVTDFMKWPEYNFHYFHNVCMVGTITLRLSFSNNIVRPLIVLYYSIVVTDGMCCVDSIVIIVSFAIIGTYILYTPYLYSTLAPPYKIQTNHSSFLSYKRAVSRRCSLKFSSDCYCFSLIVLLVI